ncbi:MAG: sigma-70 family RNA polymerase sigma factor [Prolixibacteraceae bacterium]|nr:sigma-70 family RNA polymerase sigma factor [Prolixibacteraceae bacterium]MBN2774912.1 sigma-70 family RNA polymerase sigma factor [Prolixibacteraceae bacterium]
MPLIPVKGKLKNKSDEQLLSLFLEKQDMDYLGELFVRYMHLVYGICLKYFKNRDDSKDAVMQIFEKVNTEVHNHTISNFKSWLYVVSKNYCLMELRKKGNKKFLQPEENIFVFMENKQEIHLVDNSDNLNLEKDLLNCIESLKKEQKLCIRLFYFDNKPYREIAEQMAFDEKKVKSYIQNGKRNLKICLEKKDGTKR